MAWNVALVSDRQTGLHSTMLATEDSAAFLGVIGRKKALKDDSLWGLG